AVRVDQERAGGGAERDIAVVEDDDTLVGEVHAATRLGEIRQRPSGGEVGAKILRIVGKDAHVADIAGFEDELPANGVGKARAGGVENYVIVITCRTTCLVKGDRAEVHQSARIQ